MGEGRAVDEFHDDVGCLAVIEQDAGSPILDDFNGDGFLEPGVVAHGGEYHTHTAFAAGRENAMSA